MRAIERTIETSAIELDRLHYGRLFPWVHLVRAFRIAVDPRKLLIGALALVALAAGDWAFSHLPFSADRPAAVHWPWGARPIFGVFPWPDDEPTGDTPGDAPDGAPDDSTDESAEQASRPEVWLPAAAVRQFAHWPTVFEPVRSVFAPAVLLVRADADGSDAAAAALRLVWALAVWSFFGTVLARMAAVQFARDESVPLLEALRFAASRWLWVLAAPLAPLALVGLGWGALAGVGWMLGLLPGLGPLVAGAGWVLVLIATYAAALLLIGIAAGWPLMVATVAAQRSDGFDGFSRSFDYVYSRPLYYLWCLAVTAVVGVVSLLLVTAVTALVVHLADASLGRGLGESDMADFRTIAPPLFTGTDPAPTSTGGRLASFWLHGLAALAAGFVPSFFWAAATVTYFLLRQSVDANELGEVWIASEDGRDDDLIRLAGVAASDQPAIERPALHEP
jgi:hypothetical protein